MKCLCSIKRLLLFCEVDLDLVVTRNKKGFLHLGADLVSCLDQAKSYVNFYIHLWVSILQSINESRARQPASPISLIPFLPQHRGFFVFSRGLW
jgi:hypothetical protein